MRTDLKRAYDDYVDTFRNPDGSLPKLMQLKRLHTDLVVANAKLIAAQFMRAVRTEAEKA